MKKTLLSFFATVGASLMMGQTIPNGGFESWTINTFENLQYFRTSNQGNNGLPPYNVQKTSDAASGLYAARLSTTLENGIDTVGAYIANGDPTHPTSPGQGVPYTEQTTGITGYYKGNFVNNDSSIVWVIFKQGGAIIGNYLYHIGTSQSNYTAFNFTFTPALPVTPDTMIIAFTSSNMVTGKGVPGTWVQYDSITFTGVASQPANFDGDFEFWTPQTVTTLNQWETNGVMQTSDKYSGNYALELVTYNSGNNGPSQGNATNGHGFQGGTGGGTPFSNQIDTLVFYYKFSAADANDSASVNLQFKNSGITFRSIGIFLKDTGFYKRVEVPFNLSSVPDTLLMFINSTKTWNNIPASYVGGTLKIDNMFLKSQQVPVTAFMAPATACVNQPVQLTDNSGNLPNAWSWDLTGGTPGTSNQQNPMVTYTATGSYTVGLIASNANGSGALYTQVINVNSIPTVSVNSPTMCVGDSAILIAAGASTYAWSNLDTNDSITVFPSATANYTVTGTQNGCSASATSTVTVNNCSMAISVEQTQFSLFPNPSNGLVNINSEKELGMISVFNALGEQVYNAKTSGTSAQFDLSNKPAGLYTVLIQGKRLKLVKE